MSKLYYDRSETYTSMFIQPFRILFTYNSSQRKTYYMHTAVNLSTEAVLYVMSNVPSRGDFPSILAVSNCNNVNALCVFNNNWIFLMYVFTPAETFRFSYFKSVSISIQPVVDHGCKRKQS